MATVITGWGEITVHPQTPQEQSFVRISQILTNEGIMEVEMSVGLARTFASVILMAVPKVGEPEPWTG